jgi:hypothetical protein
MIKVLTSWSTLTNINEQIRPHEKIYFWPHEKVNFDLMKFDLLTLSQFGAHFIYY